MDIHSLYLYIYLLKNALSPCKRYSFNVRVKRHFFQPISQSHFVELLHGRQLLVIARRADDELQRRATGRAGQSRGRESQHLRMDTVLELSSAFQALAHASSDHRDRVTSAVQVMDSRKKK
jgi:predicted RecB family endonuclease